MYLNQQAQARPAPSQSQQVTPWLIRRALSICNADG
jgi:hypothetical protein